jgi:hypothetical protein
MIRLWPSFLVARLVTCGCQNHHEKRGCGEPNAAAGILQRSEHRLGGQSAYGWQAQTFQYSNTYLATRSIPGAWQSPRWGLNGPEPQGLFLLR